MAEAAVTFLLEQLKEILKGYRDLITGAENEFALLNNQLESLKAFLKDTAKKKKKDNMFRQLERKITNVVFEVENLIDLCLNDAVKSGKLSNIISRPKLAKKVKSVRQDQVQPLLREFRELNDMQNVAADGSAAEDHPSPHPQANRDIPIRKNKIIGFEEEERKITGYLTEDIEKLNVISIIGIPGLGKTTLAWKVYHNETIEHCFPIRIWINISQVFNIRDIFLHILRKFSPSGSEDISKHDDNELAQIVRSCLEKQKFLLVLDDVWSVDAWKQIKEVLPENNKGAKVLITSREKNVGLQSKVQTAPHDLRCLDSDESWELLMYEVFGCSEVPKSHPEELTGIGRLIAAKCDGVPLTIVVIGGILADQLNRSPTTASSEWTMVKDNVSGALQNDPKQRITNAVQLSYDRLPDDIRECFVYLGIFPEDYEIPTKMLCGLWISEGFILRKDIRRSLEQSAEENLNDLICRNLIKVEKTSHMGRVKTCRVHDMIRAFCITKSKEANLFQEVKKSQLTEEFEPSPSELQNSHRLSFGSDLSSFLSQTPVGPHVRSFLCLYDRPVDLEAKHIHAIPTGFSKLRILESRCIKFNQFPKNVVKLIHLRYLTLNIDTITSIPKPIMVLWNLQSLLIETRSRTIAMKANIWNMIRLRYLRTKAAIVLDSEMEGDAGENLHTLNRLSPESCTERVAGKAKNLKTLGISGKLTNIFEKKFLEKLHHLEKLKLVNSLAYEQTYEDMLHTLPRWNCFPPRLKSLTLTNTFIGWQYMSTLAMIQNLEALKLRDNAFVGVSWKLNDIFPSLQLLLIMNISELVLWEVKEQAFPKLKFLVVKNCESLIEIPECLGTHLEKLETERVQKSVVKSAEKIGEMKKNDGIQFNLKIGPASASN